MNAETDTSRSYGRNIVLAIFPNAVPLKHYIQSLFDTNRNVDIRLSTDPPAFLELLTSSLIVPHTEQNIAKLPYPTPSLLDCTIRDILNRIIGSMVRTNANYRDLNCFALGYRPKSYASRMDLNPFATNFLAYYRFKKHILELISEQITVHTL